MFDEKIRGLLGFYVYMLKDPNEKYPFYIGKAQPSNAIIAHPVYSDSAATFSSSSS